MFKNITVAGETPEKATWLDYQSINFLLSSCTVQQLYFQTIPTKRLFDQQLVKSQRPPLHYTQEKLLRILFQHQ
jgi:hypothetical protein